MTNESLRQVFYALDSRYQERAQTLRHARAWNWSREQIRFRERDVRAVGCALVELERDRDSQLWSAGR